MKMKLTTNNEIEASLKKYNRIKTDLLKMAKCIDICTDKTEKELYQNVCLEYSKELKTMKHAIKDAYNIDVCSCCNDKKGI